VNISDQALPWVIGLGSLAASGLGALIAIALDRRLWNRLALKVFTRAPMSTKPPTTTELSGDWERVLDDIREAVATGREPEDVQAERHARERGERP
jgi:hypothetical protein